MKRLRFLLIGSSALALALLAGGCFLTSAQVFVHYALPNPFTIDTATLAFDKVDVDLNTIGDYSKNKDKLKGLADVAVLGTFRNVVGPAGAVEIWMTPGTTDYASISEIRANAVKLWAGSIGPTGSVVTLDWATSTKLFDPAGKAALVNEVKGDGTFTLYTFGTAATYRITVEKGVVVLVLDAGV